MLATALPFLSLTAIMTFAAVLVYASYTDFKHMKITNKTCLLGCAAYAVFAFSLLLGGDVGTILNGLGLAAAVFLVTAFMNAKNLLGGGDVKLLTVLGMWTGTPYFVDTFFIVALCGGVMAVVFYIRTLAQPTPTTTQGAVQGDPLHERPIPYGPGITIGGLFLCSELILNALS